MTSSQPRVIKRGLAIGLAAAATLAAVPIGRAESITPAPAAITRGSSDQPELDVEAMIAEAERLRLKGRFNDSEVAWRHLATIYERDSGTDHPDFATSLNNVGELLLAQERIADAEPILYRTLAIREKVLGPDHPDVATTLNNLAELLLRQGKPAAAETLVRRSIAIQEKVLATPHPDMATSLNNLAGALHLQGHKNQAEPLIRRSLLIYEKLLGLDHPKVALSLGNLAWLLKEQGRDAAAEPLIQRSLSIYQKAYGTDHQDVVQALWSLAASKANQGQFAAAEALYKRSLAIQERILWLDHPAVATTLNNLGELQRKQGQYPAAEALFQRSLLIVEKERGLDHPDVATILNNLATSKANQGQFAAAEPLYRRSLAIQEKNHGPDHPAVATTLNNLAMLLENQGQYGAAEVLFQRSLLIVEKERGLDHPDVATILNNLATSKANQGQFAAAEPLYKRSLAIQENNLGADHPAVATTLNNWAGLLQSREQYAAAESLYRRSLAIQEKNLGPDHPAVATTLNNLAVLLENQGQHGAAETLYRRSLALRKKNLGPNHPDLATTLNNLSLLLRDLNQDRAAYASLEKSLAIESSWLIREIPMLPDHARSAQLNQLGNAWQVPFGWTAAHPPAAILALETRLNRHGLLQEIEQRQALLLNTPGIDPAKVQQLQALTQQLASVTLPVERRPAVRQQRDALQAQIYRLQPDLEIQTVTIADVASALPADGALVEIQRYQPFDGRKPTGKRWGEPQYIALVLKPNGAISTVPLGATASIDAAALQALSASAQDQGDAPALWAQLSDLLLKPLLPQLSGSRQWFLSPDGELNRVPFAALPAPQQPNQLLADVVQLRVLTTGRDLVRLQTSAPSSRASLVMANPSFDRGGSGGALASARNSQPGPQRRSAYLSITRWIPLPGTEREGQQVAGLLGASLLSGPAATATALRQQQSPQVLHVATHGFFLADQDSPPTDPLRVVQEQMGSLSALRAEAPLLRSGLVFAGANQPAADPNDDGHLTAAEILKINLRGTELVVLSACSTGQGEVRTGEGVYGLQRALTVAGARSTLLSLWKVDDAATAEFMVRFYRRLKAGEGRADALAAVQAEFRVGAVKGPMGEDWSTPYFWAAWQLTGDWGPIQGL